MGYNIYDFMNEQGKELEDFIRKINDSAYKEKITAQLIRSLIRNLGTDEDDGLKEYLLSPYGHDVHGVKIEYFRDNGIKISFEMPNDE